MMLRLLAIFCLFAAPATQAEPFDHGKLQALSDTTYQALHSETLGHALHVYVRVPESAAENPDQKYTVVYLLDGGVTFPLISAYYHYLRYTEEIPELVLVGISYGSDTFEGGNFRSNDFTAPAADRDYWGGAPIFQGVLETELFPMVESRYPADSQRRVLMGQSLGGQFALYCALTRPDLFAGLMASNPALHRNLDFFLGWKGSSAMPEKATHLFIGAGEFDADRFKTPRNEWIEHWTRPEVEKPFVLQVTDLPGQTHVSAATETFRHGIQWLLQQGVIE